MVGRKRGGNGFDFDSLPFSKQQAMSVCGLLFVVWLIGGFNFSSRPTGDFKPANPLENAKAYVHEYLDMQLQPYGDNREGGRNVPLFLTGHIKNNGPKDISTLVISWSMTVKNPDHSTKVESGEATITDIEAGEEYDIHEPIGMVRFGTATEIRYTYDTHVWSAEF